MATKLGTLSHAKGFVINKLRKQRKFGGSHVPVQFLSEGYPLEWRHLITEAVRQLKNEKVIHVENKRTGRSTTSHAKLTKNGLAMKRGLLNAYLKAERLPTLGRDLRTPLPARRRGSRPPAG